MSDDEEGGEIIQFHPRPSKSKTSEEGVSESTHDTTEGSSGSEHQDCFGPRLKDCCRETLKKYVRSSGERQSMAFRLFQRNLRPHPVMLEKLELERQGMTPMQALSELRRRWGVKNLVPFPNSSKFDDDL